MQAESYSYGIEKMSWKNLTQYGLADALLSKHDSLKELDDVHQIIDWPEIEGLLSPLY